jgi:hypothetical protein
MAQPSQAGTQASVNTKNADFYRSVRLEPFIALTVD